MAEMRASERDQKAGLCLRLATKHTKPASFPCAIITGRFQLTGQTIKASRNNEGAFIKAIEAEMKGLTTDMVNNLSRQLFNDGSAYPPCLPLITVDSTEKASHRAEN